MTSGAPSGPRSQSTDWEPVVGLEIHVQLKTRTKMFCRCPVGFGAAENTQTCPVCLGFPGALPVPNRQAIEWTIKLGLALGCEVAPRAVFARKNYFYPDLPKGYQISQYDQPSCINGRMIVPLGTGDHVVGIVRAHLEEDAAKTLHVGGATGRIGGAAHSLVDFNRGGTPLVEIVTAPDLRSSEDAKRFLQLLRQTIVELGVSDAEMEKGTLRVDANVSVRPAGSSELRTRCELKNMNSFTYVARGIDAEVARQVAVWESGEELQQETFDFDAATGALTPRRSKEEADDYRYFPEPDLVPIEPPADLVERLRGEIGELPGARLARLARDRGVGWRDAVALNTDVRRVEIFEIFVAAGLEPGLAASTVLNDLASLNLDDVIPNAGKLALVIAKRQQLPRSTYDAAVTASVSQSFTEVRFLSELSVEDEATLEPIVDAILAANPGQVEAYRGGKQGLLGFFVGQVMKETGGTANARVVSEIVARRLAG